MKRLMHFNRRKPLLIGGLTVLVAVLLVFVVWPRGPKTLASFPFLSEVPGRGNQPGIFTISNRSSNSATLSVMAVETFADKAWRRVQGRSRATNELWKDFAVLPPGDACVIRFDPPPGTNKWRGVILVWEEKQGFAGQLAKARVFWSQFKAGGIRGASWPKGGVLTSTEVVTQEITP